jgi:hypothetical protein
MFIAQGSSENSKLRKERHIAPTELKSANNLQTINIASLVSWGDQTMASRRQTR